MIFPTPVKMAVTNATIAILIAVISDAEKLVTDIIPTEAAPAAVNAKGTIVFFDISTIDILLFFHKKFIF